MVLKYSDGGWPMSEVGYDLSALGNGSNVVQGVVKEGPQKGEQVAVKIADIKQKDEDVHSYVAIFKVKSEMWLVMPLIPGGSCECLIKHLKRVTDVDIIAYILREAAVALQHFHNSKQIHRDLKAANILISSRGDILLADFGVAASLKDAETRTTFVGTPCWMAPEVLQSLPYDNKADVWSFGITAMELANGEAPMQSLPPLRVMMMIQKQEPPSLDAAGWAHCPAFVNLVKSCLQKDPQKRPTIEEVLKTHQKFFARGDEGKAKLITIIAKMPSFSSTKSKATDDPFASLGDEEGG
eukprot:GHVL01043807.1.p1 GENE.GHVL01043807.1~~GHVL01043807.1.p1  ORF type:complete len:297 (-),score=58.74 GHVL01043807.1:136-1026(-)